MTMNAYRFAHQELPHSFHKEPKSPHFFPAAGAMAQTRVILQMLWGRGNPMVNAPADLQVCAIASEGAHAFTFVAMPFPKMPAEAYYVAMVKASTTLPSGAYLAWDRAAEPGKCVLREHKPSAGGPKIDEYMLINCGSHDAGGLDAFAAVVAEHVGCGPLKLTRAPGWKEPKIAGAKKGGKGLLWVAVALVFLLILAAVGGLAFAEFGRSADQARDPIATKRIKAGEPFDIKTAKAEQGGGVETVWLRVNRAKKDNGKFAVEGSIRCRRGKKKFKKKAIKISSADKGKVFLTSGVNGDYRLARHSFEPGSARLRCSGTLDVAKGSAKKLKVVVTRFQKPTDFLP